MRSFDELAFSWYPQDMKYYAKVAAVDAGMSIGISGSLYPLSMVWMTQQKKMKSGHLNFRQACSHVHANRSWFAGFPISAATEIPGIFAYLTGRGVASAIFGDEGYAGLIQSPVATSCGMVFWAPGLRLSLLQQVSAGEPRYQMSAWQHAMQIIRTQGIRDLYRGTKAYAVIFGVADFLGTLLQNTALDQFESKDRKRGSVQLAATLIGFSLSSVLTIPLEAALLPYMTQEVRQGFVKKQSISELAKGIYRRDGIRGFTRGLPVGVLHLGLWHAIIPGKVQAKEYLQIQPPCEC